MGGGRQLKQKEGPLHAAMHQVKKRQQQSVKVQSGFGNAGSPYGLNMFDCKSKKIDGNEASGCLIALMLIPREHFFLIWAPHSKLEQIDQGRFLRQPEGAARTPRPSCGVNRRITTAISLHLCSEMAKADRDFFL